MITGTSEGERAWSATPLKVSASTLAALFIRIATSRGMVAPASKPRSDRPTTCACVEVTGPGATTATKLRLKSTGKLKPTSMVEESCGSARAGAKVLL